MIRDDFHRPNGPRGHGDHADVDTEAEIRIRDRLTAAFPTWGYRGEETGSSAMAEPPRYVWLVDPNDGTRSYLEGFRGSSVSIALLRDQQPVLGVVYSPTAPDSAGDLIAWAEGCGPVARNGQPVTREPWPDAIGPHDEVLIAHTQSDPRAHLDFFAPGRFRPMTSIAYRLALAAVGDATVGATAHGVADWDYAGGHALLRAVGGELFNGTGIPAQYSPRGESQGYRCYGTAAPIVRPLLERQLVRTYVPWSTQSPFSLGPIHLHRGSAIADAGLLSRAQGCWLGQLAGDALGSRVEFQSAHQIAARFPTGLAHLADGGTWNTMAGQPTDDSELATMLARTLARSTSYDADRVAFAYAYWVQSNPFDIGATTSQALRAAPAARSIEAATADGFAAAMLAAASRSSQANGSLMRISPLGIWGNALPYDRVAELARLDSALTHPHPVCQEAAAVYTVAIAAAVSHGGTPQEVYAEAMAWAKANCREISVLEAITAAANRPPADFMHQQGWVLLAFQNAFYQLLHATAAADGIIATVMAGGDTDTNAAIAGALLGAVHGREAIPWQWRRLILSCRPVDGAPGVYQPRPAAFWPVDALELAERLLLAGASAT